jgi:hypothetical protein
VFANRHGEPMTRDGIACVLAKHAAAPAQANPARQCKHITPHVLRHSCAVALLQSGIDVTVISDYLGHASIATTGRYIATNLQMKRDAMQASGRRRALRQGPGRGSPRLTCSPSFSLSDRADLMRRQGRCHTASRVRSTSAPSHKTTLGMMGLMRC